MSKLIMVDGSPIKYQIWDTAGAGDLAGAAPAGAAAAARPAHFSRVR